MSKEIRTSQFSKIKRMFELQSEDKKELGSYINLATIIKGRNYNKNDIRRAFLKLVDREEYDFKERQEYIDYLYVINERNNK